MNIDNLNLIYYLFSIILIQIGFRIQLIIYEKRLYSKQKLFILSIHVF